MVEFYSRRTGREEEMMPLGRAVQLPNQEKAGESLPEAFDLSPPRGGEAPTTVCVCSCPPETKDMNCRRCQENGIWAFFWSLCFTCEEAAGDVLRGNVLVQARGGSWVEQELVRVSDRSAVTSPVKQISINSAKHVHAPWRKKDFSSRLSAFGGFIEPKFA
ncbi:unnamed protein product [Pleuronectes platessa]|uniref:Uncharacterized protein n=1 Tax=Pleuronectes platessa TaxID=8262 RepID=A0A9N7TPR9_PLEPL|nr:unnamed protein product [Pleuronectes platessa]